ncbi:MAG: hypothetical protein P4N60_02330 [Verrucomicrobiae bacterium]|nr:hypothetical protein [Verrucomicrobiae bacterium]
MISIILLALANLGFAVWILGWSLWHSYLALSRFFKAQFQGENSNRSNLSLRDESAFSTITEHWLISSRRPKNRAVKN